MHICIYNATYIYQSNKKRKLLHFHQCYNLFQSLFILYKFRFCFTSTKQFSYMQINKAKMQGVGEEINTFGIYQWPLSEGQRQCQRMTNFVQWCSTPFLALNGITDCIFAEEIRCTTIKLDKSAHREEPHQGTPADKRLYISTYQHKNSYLYRHTYVCMYICLTAYSKVDKRGKSFFYSLCIFIFFNKMLGGKVNGNYTKMLHADLNKSSKNHYKTAPVWPLTSNLTNHQRNKIFWVLLMMFSYRLLDIDTPVLANQQKLSFVSSVQPLCAI